MGNTKYTYAVARIRALEVALFSDAVIEQLLSCKTAAEALQFVVEKGWGDMADQDDPDVVANGANCFALRPTSMGCLLETGLGKYKYG